MSFITKNCEYCSKEFQASEREHKRGNARFCSLSCSASRKRITTEPNTTCSYCGEYFYRQASHKNNAKATGLQFCSRKCKDHAQRLGGIEAIQPYHYGTGLTGNKTYRALALRSYPVKCIDCNYDNFVDVLEVHHLSNDGGRAELSNLVIVCPTCHVERHNGHRPNVDYNGNIIPL